jgi:hypothetical protein
MIIHYLFTGMSKPDVTPGDGRITVVPATEVKPDDEVRHVDQLPDRAKRAVIAAEEGRTAPPNAPALAELDVDVVVFTEYYRVE